MGANRSAGVYQPRSRKGQIADALNSFRAWVIDLLAETLWRSLGIALLVLAIAVFVSLLSYDAADPSLNVATGREPSNWLGATGAYGADLLFQLFGVAALAFGLTLAAWGWRASKGGRFSQFALRALALILGALLLAAALGAVPELLALPAGTGGIPGRMTMFFTGKIATAFSAPWLGVVVPILFAALGLVLVFLATGIRAAALGHAALTIGGAAWRGTLALGRLAFRRRERAQQEDASEDEEAETASYEDDFDDDTDIPRSDEAYDAPARRDLTGKRVQRDERRRKPKGKADLQPALNLAEGEYQLPPLGLLAREPGRRPGSRLFRRCARRKCPAFRSCARRFRRARPHRRGAPRPRGYALRTRTCGGRQILARHFALGRYSAFHERGCRPRRRHSRPQRHRHRAD